MGRAQVERMESMTWAGATPVPRQPTQHHTFYCILHSILNTYRIHQIRFKPWESSY